MPRMFRTATLVALAAFAACKSSEKSAVAPAKPVESARSGGPGAPALPDPAAASPGSAAGSAAPAAPVAAANTELEDRGIAAMQKMADMFVADAKDCDKLGADLKAFIAENKALIGQLAELEDHQTDDQRAAFAKRNGAAQAAIGQKMQGALAACASSPAVLAAMKDFPGN